MFIKQSDLFWGLGKEFMIKVMDVSHKECYRKGTFLFREGETADKFYILVTGRVRLETGDKAAMVHTVCHAGEAFGWSGLAGRSEYSASAKCSEDVSLVRFQVDEIQEIVDSDLANGLKFYKHLSKMLGKRLINSYLMIHAGNGTSDQETFGSGQMIESDLEDS